MINSVYGSKIRNNSRKIEVRGPAMVMLEKRVGKALEGLYNIGIKWVLLKWEVLV